jgi:hypothetical protein
MSNADQLKYERMKEYLDKKPTPIRKHASNPEPIVLTPKPSFADTLDERIEATVKKVIYQLMRSEETINIAVMSYEDFEVFWQRVMEEDA